MYKIGKYKGYDQMSNLICENHGMLLVMSRFGMALGFGDKSIEDVCRESRVDSNTFLAVVNLLIENEKEQVVSCDIDIYELIKYLKKSHSYFLEFRLPSIREKLMKTIGCDSNDIALLIIKYYDEYVSEVEKHIMYEEEVVFPYVEKLLNSGDSGKYSISVFSRRHDKVEEKLDELKNIIIKYYPVMSSNELNGVIFDIFSCSEDLASHNCVENNIFTPAIRNLEVKK